MKTEKQAKKGGLIKRFMPYYKRHLGTLSFDLFCAALTTLCELALPIIVREITGTATDNPENLTLKFILTLGAIYIVLKIIDAVAYYYMASIGHIMGTKIETEMRKDFFGHLESAAVGLGLVNRIMSEAQLEDIRKALGFDENSRILLISTEGATDPVGYERVVGKKA